MERLLGGLLNDGLERVLAVGRDEFRLGCWSGSNAGRCNHEGDCVMHVVVSDFISLDGVVPAPGPPGEDNDGAFAHGGWSMPYFDPDTMGPAIDDLMASTEALLFGRAAGHARPGRRVPVDDRADPARRG